MKKYNVLDFGFLLVVGLIFSYIVQYNHNKPKNCFDVYMIWKKVPQFENGKIV